MKDNRTTVLMTADTVGGVWTYCMDLIRSMQTKNVHYHLVTAGKLLNDSQRTEAAGLKNLTLHETEFKLEWMDNPWHDIEFSGWQLLELERKLKPDVIHLNSYSYASLPFRSPVIVVAHSDVFSWWFSVRKTIPGPEWQEYFRRVKEGIRNADCVIAPSHAMLDMLTSIYGMPADARVIHNGRNSKLFKPAALKTGRIMCAGRFWDEAKNVDLLIRAAEEIKCEIIVAGDCGDTLKKQVHHNIRFCGRLSSGQISEQLAHTAIYVAPAKYEPFGLSVLEAALCGCALVLGNIASLKEIWKDAAVYVDTDDAVALAETCNRLLTNDELVRSYAEKAMQRAKIFSLQKMTERYSSLYDELVKSGKELETMQIG